MDCKGTCLGAALILVLISTFSNAQSKGETHEPLLLNTAKIDTNTTTKIDGVTVLQVPGSEIEKDKVVAMLERVDLSFRDIASVHAKEDNIEENIEKLKQLLHDERVGRDQELEFVVHTMLGSSYLRLYQLTHQTKLLDQSKTHVDAAIAMFKDQPRYKADLVDAYTGRLAVFSLQKKYGKVISLKKFLIENFQDVGYGPYTNWFASRQVQGLYNLVAMDVLKSSEKREIVDYLEGTAQKFGNEVGIVAQIYLLKHFAQQDKYDKARTLFVSIERRLSSLKNPAFEKEYIERAKGYIDRMEYDKKSSGQLAESDTLFYEIRPKMVQQARVSKAKIQGITEYRISVRLKEDYYSEFAQLTGDNIGNFLAIKHDGQVISESLPTIQARISTGRFPLGPYKSEEEAKKILQEITNDDK